jgi:hypothetical protein
MVAAGDRKLDSELELVMARAERDLGALGLTQRMGSSPFFLPP